MTPAQFDLIAALARMRPHSKARQAARLYILGGMKQSDIAAQLGISQPTVSDAARRFMRAWIAARQA